MEAKNMLFVASMLVAVLAAMNGVSAADAPAPAPTSDATIFVPTFLASIVALASALLF